MSRTSIRHEFVETVPSEREDGVLYVSIEFEVTVHNCFCGCGSKIALPLSPTDWRLIFDGDTVSLWPSVGNWSYPCESHYFIERDEVVWAGGWSRAQIEAGRKADQKRKAAYYDGSVGVGSRGDGPYNGGAPTEPRGAEERRGPWARLKSFFTR
jgi:hypothetical protein